ncbi:hypothetical protein B0J12DRAFT_645188 [Macrophomina phaseolina]|uniref:Uncharacterized protein n=1 Tax=Macrophomina phaseolina TaxID=35725 RepID=A0ABQ8GQA8_9PEZI|nr:hypothetical protein B0J12DRAFT_645188 [Macrophomina phaseolina]
MHLRAYTRERRLLAVAGLTASFSELRLLGLSLVWRPPTAILNELVSILYSVVQSWLISRYYLYIELAGES